MGQAPCESLASETKGIMDCTAQSKIFAIFIELQHVESYEDNQLKVLKPVFCVFLGSNLNLECRIKLIDLGFLVFVCIAGTMANSLIAVFSCCIIRLYCMHLNHGISTSSPDYLYCLLAYGMLRSHAVCQFHTQPVSYCQPM